MWKLADFGLSMEGSSNTHRATQYAYGTPGYRAPELLAGDGQPGTYNNKVDIWAMGCILYELATRTCPFKNDFAILDYRYSGGNMHVVLDGSFDKASAESITKSIVDMLQVEPSDRPSASFLSKEFDSELQLAQDHIQLRAVNTSLTLLTVTDEIKMTSQTLPKHQVTADAAKNDPPAPPSNYVGYDVAIAGNIEAIKPLPVTTIFGKTDFKGPEGQDGIIIGIDFGTAFTGVAFGLSTTGDLDLGRFEQSVTVIKSWPNSSLAYMEKVPTILAYNTDPPSWGGQVRSRDELQVTCFKLGLQPDAEKHYGPAINVDWKHPMLLQKTAADFTADFLKGILHFVLEEYLPQYFGKAFLRNQQISFVMTIPAIWSDAAKSLTRQAAVRAGIPERKLELVTEAEAAALYCVTLYGKDFQPGDCFLVCDAGSLSVVNSSLNTV